MVDIQFVAIEGNFFFFCRTNLQQHIYVYTQQVRTFRCSFFNQIDCKSFSSQRIWMTKSSVRQCVIIDRVINCVRQIHQFVVHLSKATKILHKTDIFGLDIFCAVRADPKGIAAQKMKFSIKGFFTKCGQIRRKMRIW